MHIQSATQAVTLSGAKAQSLFHPIFAQFPLSTRSISTKLLALCIYFQKNQECCSLSKNFPFEAFKPSHLWCTTSFPFLFIVCNSIQFFFRFWRFQTICNFSIYSFIQCINILYMAVYLFYSNVYCIAWAFFGWSFVWVCEWVLLTESIWVCHFMQQL